MSFGPPSERLTDPRSQLAVTFAHAAFDDPHGIEESLWDQLGEHFSDREIMELVFVIGFYTGSQLMTHLLDTDLTPVVN